jgi:hypothetical protein
MKNPYRIRETEACGDPERRRVRTRSTPAKRRADDEANPNAAPRRPRTRPFSCGDIGDVTNAVTRRRVIPDRTLPAKSQPSVGATAIRT